MFDATSLFSALVAVARHLLLRQARLTGVAREPQGATSAESLGCSSEQNCWTYRIVRFLLGVHVLAGCVLGFVGLAVVAFRSFLTDWDRGAGRGGVVG